MSKILIIDDEQSIRTTLGKILEDEGVDYVFGVPGAAILPLYKALSTSTRIKNISVRHEEGGTHAADGYARATGKVGISIGTSGPAGTNMITGLYTCLADSIPIICITGQAPSTVLHREAFQAVSICQILFAAKRGGDAEIFFQQRQTFPGKNGCCSRCF